MTQPLKRARKTRSSGKSVDAKTKSLCINKFSESGLSEEDAKILGIEMATPKQTAKLHPSFKELSSLKINYYGPDGKPLSDWAQSTPFYRVRYLEVETGFSSLTNKKPVRYVQEPNTAPVAYYPRNFENWEDLCQDVDQPLIITEGELKAAKACKEGFATIGLGGVYNWRSNKLGIEWLDSLDYIDWKKRNVYVCFDSDYTTNPMVCSALKSFAEELERRGSFVKLVQLPNVPPLDKVGLDDYLVNAGPSSIDMFHELLSCAEPLGLAASLWELNEKYCYIRNPGLIVVKNDLSYKVSPSAFKDHLESTSQYQERQIKADGSISYKTVSAAAVWLKWPLRLSMSKLTYKPGKEIFTDGLYNSWPGWGVQSKKGSVKPFLELVDHIFKEAEPESKKWFLKWCAYPLQYPGTKLFTSVVIHGIRHGTGKSLIGYSLAKIYGKNFTEISQMDLHNHFNEWAESKQFVLGDDVTGSNKRQDADFLKKMITQKELRINAKYTPSYVVPDCINYLFTSQHPDSFFLEDDDRRFFIHEVLVAPKEEDFYMDYGLWLDTGGAEAIFHYLLNVDVGDFNPNAPAFKSSAKERMIDTGRSDLASWVRQLMLVPDQILKIGKIKIDKDLLTSKELLALYDPSSHTGTTANGLGRELARAGVRQVYNGRPIRLNDGSQSRYYAVKNADLWHKSNLAAITEHLNQKMRSKKGKY